MTNLDRFKEDIDTIGLLHPEVLDHNHPIAESIEYVLCRYPELADLPDGFQLAWRLALAYLGQSQPIM